MRKYIDRAALFNSLSDAKTVEEVFAAIQAAPAADVVEVVRCKDCKWFDACVNGNVFKILDVEDYCSYGEKKDGQ